MAACDLQRPAAVEQLKTLGAKRCACICALLARQILIKVAKAALAQAKTNRHDLLIVDTAGRLHIDDDSDAAAGAALKRLLSPAEMLFVANATTGQDAVNVAAEFNKRVANSPARS